MMDNELFALAYSSSIIHHLFIVIDKLGQIEQ